MLMKIMNISTSMWILLVTASKFWTADIVEAAIGSCACKAEELGFAIDCEATEVMLEALSFLNSNACATNCSSEACEKSYYIVQAHHDYCPEEKIPEAVEDGFHDYDEVCLECTNIAKKSFVEGAIDCPTPDCYDKGESGNAAYTSLIVAACNIDCSSSTCRDLFFTLKAVHDTCDHDVLSQAAEEGMHDLEVPCAVHICNDPASFQNQLTCDHEDEDEDEDGGHDHDHGHHDHGEDEMSSSSRTGLGVASAVGSLVAVLVATGIACVMTV